MMKKFLLVLFCMVCVNISAMATNYPNNATGFIVACQKGETNIVENYIQSGMNVNKPYMDATPLIMAIYSGNDQTVELLLKNGADPNLERATLTPLHFAIRRQQADIDQHRR